MVQKDNDGEFYMSFNLHFLKFFGEIEIVHLDPRDTKAQNNISGATAYDIFHLFGKWEDEAVEGGVDGSIGK